MDCFLVYSVNYVGRHSFHGSVVVHVLVTVLVEDGLSLISVIDDSFALLLQQ